MTTTHNAQTMSLGRDGASASDELTALRCRLDAVDRELLDCLRERLECCIAIGRVKQAAAVPMMQPRRIDLVHQRAARYAAEHGIDGDFLRRLYELIIAETCRVETLVMAEAEQR